MAGIDPTRDDALDVRLAGNHHPADFIRVELSVIYGLKIYGTARLPPAIFPGKFNRCCLNPRIGSTKLPDKRSDDEPQKKFRITKKRLGTIRFIDPKGDFGFSEAEDFREDVFFHFSAWQPESADETAARSAAPLRPERDRGRDSRGYNRGGFDRGRGGPNRGGRPMGHVPKMVPEDLVGRNVEFEIDDELFETEKRLRATTVQPTKRPLGRKMSGRDATFKIVTHHPRARRKRPDWRK